MHWLVPLVPVALVACAGGRTNPPGTSRARQLADAGTSGAGDSAAAAAGADSFGKGRGGQSAAGVAAHGGSAADSGESSGLDAGFASVCPNTMPGKFVSMSTTNAASARSSPYLMWTGSEMLVYDRCAQRSDALYSPCADTWRQLPWSRSSCAAITLEAPSKVYLLGGTPLTFTELDGNTASGNDLDVSGMPSTMLPSVVATNSGVIVWGGATQLPDDEGNTGSNAGAVYDRSSNRWRAMSTAGAPSARIAPAVWSRAGFAVWGGHSATSIQTPDGRFDCLAYSDPPCTLLQDGAIYDLVSDSWTPIAAAGQVPSARRDHLMAWVDGKLLVWGGMGGVPMAFTRDGALYDPQTKRWTKIADLPDAATFWTFEASIWSGSRILHVGDGSLASWSYTLGSSAWNALPGLAGVYGCSMPKLSFGALASLCTDSSNGSTVAALLKDGATAWARYPVPADMVLERSAALWNGAQLLVWGGNPAPVLTACPPGFGCDPVSPMSVNTGEFVALP
jgi:Kelch motif